MIYLTSDLHLCHNNILTIEPEARPFRNIEEHDSTLIDNWNKTISPIDEVYVVGDFIMGEAENVERIIPRLNGKEIHLIRGNHDTDSKCKKYEELGISVSDIKCIQYKGLYFILCHFPIQNLDFWKMVTGRRNANSTFLCYGHVHSYAPEGFHKETGTYHIGVNTNNLYPISLEKIYQDIVRATAN